MLFHYTDCWWLHNRVKKLVKQADRLQLELNEARAEARDLKLQLSEAGDFKV